MRFSDVCSDVCSSDLGRTLVAGGLPRFDLTLLRHASAPGVLESGVLAGPPSGVPAQRTAARRVPPAAVRTRLDMTTGRSPGYRHPTLSTEEDRMSAERLAGKRAVLPEAAAGIGSESTPLFPREGAV